MPVQNNINLMGGFQRPIVDDDTFEVKVKDIRSRHIDADKFTGMEKDVLDFDFEVLSGTNKGTVLGKGFITPKITPPSGGKSASNLYTIICAIFGTPDEEELASYVSGGSEFLNSLIDKELRVVTKDSRIISYLAKKKWTYLTG